MNCLLKSADLVPIKQIDARRALVLWLLDKVWIAEEHEGKVIRSVKETFPAPAVVVVKKYVSMPAHYYSDAPLTLRNLKKRDKYCMYCGKYPQDLKHGQYMTCDHIMPKSRGGKHKWENVALSCVTCNNKKGRRTPEEAGMPLLREPFAPTRWEL